MYALRDQKRRAFLFSEDFSKFFAASGTIRHFRVGIQVEGNILSATEPPLSQFVRIKCEPSFYTAQHRKNAHKRFVRTCGGTSPRSAQ